MKKQQHLSGDPATLTGIILSLGIAFTDLGTAPMYVMKAVAGGSDGATNPDFILGAVSCLIWILTLQTTLKYVLVVLRSDNQGEGGIMALYARVRKRKKSLFLAAILGAAALLAGGVIAPSITVLSAAEGLKISFPSLPVLPVALGIIAALFLAGRFGMTGIGKSFGPIMLIWFITLATLGLPWIIRMPGILKAFNPLYAANLLLSQPGGFIVLGAIFLATAGAEVLFSGLSQCGYRNIRAAWVFVKITLIISYLGQGAWMLMPDSPASQGVNPFFGIMPSWFLPAGVLLATIAAVIAGLAMIARSHVLISEAVSLNFWPKLRIRYPAANKSRIYISSLNWILLAACIAVILAVRESSGLTAAYGLALSAAMLMTTVLASACIETGIRLKGFLLLFIAIFLLSEGSALTASLLKFYPYGWLALLPATPVCLVMFAWFRARKIRNRYTRFVGLEDHYQPLEDLSHDQAVPKYATNLVYLTRANHAADIETKIIHSIFQKNPKRADTYWLLHIDVSDDPQTLEYSVNQLIPGVLIRLEFRLGFKVRPRINLLFNQVIKEISCNDEIDFLSRYPSLRKHEIPADFRFIVIHRIQNPDFVFPKKEQLVMDQYSLLSRMALPDFRFYGLEACNTVTEEVPLISAIDDTQWLKRVFHSEP